MVVSLEADRMMSMMSKVITRSKEMIVQNKHSVSIPLGNGEIEMVFKNPRTHKMLSFGWQWGITGETAGNDGLEARRMMETGQH